MRGEIVERGSVLAPDLDDISEALRSYEGGARAFSLEQGVRRHCGAMRECLDPRVVNAEALDARQHTFGLLGGAGHLGRDNATVDDGHDVGEGTSHVDSDAHAPPPASW